MKLSRCSIDGSRFLDFESGKPMLLMQASPALFSGEGGFSGSVSRRLTTLRCGGSAPCAVGFDCHPFPQGMRSRCSSMEALRERSSAVGGGGGFGVSGETSVVDRRVFRCPGEAPFDGLRW
ncbi:unnamed protein product [Brassica napus]|uniref:(rape) hypothetical protein n=1 Tax=Brassica napus TaxID=3708 RepID=A0A817B1Z5_BRANA|nr:unnamed protein product [Brassica napus]